MLEYLKNKDRKHLDMFGYLLNKYGKNYWDKEELLQEMSITYFKLKPDRLIKTGNVEIDEINNRYIRSCLENCCKATISKINGSNSLLTKSKRKEFRELLNKYENKEPLTKEEIFNLHTYENLDSIEHSTASYFEAITIDNYEFEYDFILNLLDNEYDKKIIHLSFYEGLTDGEIGKELNKSRTTIRDRKKKILRDLKETLLDLGIDEDILKEMN